ncbi:MAG: ribosome maturation factor RimM [bacterium]
MSRQPRAAGAGDALLIVVELTRPHGIRGEMSGRPAGVEPEDLRDVPLVLRRRNGATEPAKIGAVRSTGRAWIVALEGIGDRNEAETLRGAVLLARRSDLPEPGPGEWYIADLVGLVMVDETGEELGVLEEVLKLPANDVFVVRGRRGEVLVPALDDVIVQVDRDAGRMRVKLPRGLLDPAEPEAEEER